jgi:hypothetical protein
VIPNTLHAGAYSLVRHYLSTAKAMGVADELHPVSLDTRLSEERPER